MLVCACACVVCTCEHIVCSAVCCVWISLSGHRQPMCISVFVFLCVRVFAFMYLCTHIVQCIVLCVDESIGALATDVYLCVCVPLHLWVCVCVFACVYFCVCVHT